MKIRALITNQSKAKMITNVECSYLMEKMLIPCSEEKQMTFPPMKLLEKQPLPESKFLNAVIIEDYVFKGKKAKVSSTKRLRVVEEELVASGPELVKAEIRGEIRIIEDYCNGYDVSQDLKGLYAIPE